MLEENFIPNQKNKSENKDIALLNKWQTFYKYPTKLPLLETFLIKIASLNTQ